MATGKAEEAIFLAAAPVSTAELGQVGHSSIL